MNEAEVEALRQQLLAAEEKEAALLAELKEKEKAIEKEKQLTENNYKAIKKLRESRTWKIHASICKFLPSLHGRRNVQQ